MQVRLEQVSDTAIHVITSSDDGRSICHTVTAEAEKILGLAPKLEEFNTKSAWYEREVTHENCHQLADSMGVDPS